MARGIRILRNTIQDYDWGSTTAMADLLGVANDEGAPQAELWMGAHPKAPSSLEGDSGPVRLDEAIAEAPEEFLGPETVRAFDGRLPFLFKVLAAGEPLSIQAHPNLEQAREGFERENKSRIPLSAFNRNYRDDNHKPELICALTPFWAMCGFRRIDAIVSGMEQLAGGTLRDELAQLRKQPDREGLKRFFHSLMTLSSEKRTDAVGEAVEAGRGRPEPEFQWTARLAKRYPGDMGTLCPALLNLVRLEPGEALYLPAGVLHAYLEGVGVEIMANSDNVLRGGLTPKHVDVPELLHVLTFESGDLTVLRPRETRKGEAAYPSEAREFRLSVVTPKPGAPYESARRRGFEILLCVEGRVTIAVAETGESTALERGVSVAVPAAAPAYCVEGDGRLFKASVPLGRLDG